MAFLLVWTSNFIVRNYSGIVFMLDKSFGTSLKISAYTLEWTSVCTLEWTASFFIFLSIFIRFMDINRLKKDFKLVISNSIATT